jgi:hypothetical protein
MRFVLFKRRQILVFFIFAMTLGAALPVTNAFGGAFLDDFKTSYPGTFGVEHPMCCCRFHRSPRRCSSWQSRSSCNVSV